MSRRKKSQQVVKLPKKESVICEVCGQLFSKQSNLTAHVNKVHKGLRWACPLCKEEQVSYYSHKRHFQLNHPSEPVPTRHENKELISGNLDQPPEALKANIKNWK